MDITQEIFIKIYTSLDRFKRKLYFFYLALPYCSKHLYRFLRKKKDDTFPIKEEIATGEMKLGSTIQSPEEFVETKS